MAKHIVILSDGTGNTAVKGRGTNVFKMFESIDLNAHRFDPQLAPQVAIYDDGVGTESFKPLKMIAGATGYGLSRNVKQLYKELCRVYDPGDRIFLFGFSRGAFTVRTLAGLICACGIVNARAQPTASDFEQIVRMAYKTYRERYRTALMKLFLGEPSRDAAKQFKAQCCHGIDTKIAFIGVWDTVDAVGLPFHLGDMINTLIYRFKFPDRQLSSQVERAYHALAIDDERHSFHPLLWEEAGSRHENQIVEQAWFAGAHSNVGGGYPKQGMSLVALDWMMQKAAEADLRFVDADRTFYREHANVDDKLYDPRAGLGIFYRWKARDITAICRDNGVEPAVHLSVLERIAHGTDDYGPGNLPPNATVVITPTGDPLKDGTAWEHARETEDVLKTAHTDRKPLLARVRKAVFFGHVSYYVYLLSCIAVLIAAATPPDERGFFGLWLLKHPIDTFISVVRQLLANPVLLGWLALGFGAAYLMALYADHRMGAVFSRFWFQHQQRLRDALKRARELAKEMQTGAPSYFAGDVRRAGTIEGPDAAPRGAK